MSNSFVSPWTVAHQSSLSVGFPRQGYWSGLPFPFQGGSSWPTDQICISWTDRQILYHWATREVHKWQYSILLWMSNVPVCVYVCVCVCVCVKHIFFYPFIYWWTLRCFLLIYKASVRLTRIILNSSILVSFDAVNHNLQFNMDTF